jgi:hypothetical protein
MTIILENVVIFIVWLIFLVFSTITGISIYYELQNDKKKIK